MNNNQTKVTLSMVVHNEANRYLKRALEAHRSFIDEAVIIDDGSTDNTADLCEQLLEGIPLTLIRNPVSSFSNEVMLRKQQWKETVRTNPSWILNLDADEVFEESFAQDIKQIITQTDYDAVYFRLYDMWSETHYREDQYWQAHRFVRPFMVRYRQDVINNWKETPQHCGRFPLSVWQFPYLPHPARIKHYGWANADDRLMKYHRYQRLDPGAKYGWAEQYESILDEHPHLIPWEE